MVDESHLVDTIGCLTVGCQIKYLIASIIIFVCIIYQDIIMIIIIMIL